MKETLITIAMRTGFSISTVSRVLSGNATSSRISPKTVDIIMREAKRCNYTPSLLAKSLRTHKSKTIGLLVPSISNPYFADITSVIISEARRYGYTTIVSSTMEDANIQKESITALISRQVDGMIIIPCGTDSSFLEQVNDQYVPIVLVDRYYEHSPLPYVVTNNYQGGLDAMNLLLSHGHRNIACIQGVPHSTPNKRRIDGYMEALRNANLEKNALVVGNDFSVQNGYLETKLLLNNRNYPTAIFALSNTIALGAIKAIREARLSIPKDISIVSFDNNLYLDFLVPPITRIGQLVDEMGKMAVKLLQNNIVNEQPLTSQIELSPTTIIRSSVADIPPKQPATEISTI